MFLAAFCIVTRIEINYEMPAELIIGSFFVAVITIVNCVSVKAAVRMQDAFTYAKLICVAMLTIIGIIELAKGEANCTTILFSCHN